MQASAWTWDTIYSGGLFYVCLYGVALLLLICYLLYARTPVALLVGGVMSAAAAIIILLSSSVFYGWYLYPILIIIPFLILGGRQHNRRLYWLGGVVIAVTLITTTSPIMAGYSYTWKHNQHLLSVDSIQDCVYAQLNQIQPIDLIVNDTDADLQLNMTAYSVAAPLNPWPAFQWLNGGYRDNHPARIAILSSVHLEPVQTLPTQVEADMQIISECQDIQILLLEKKSRQ